MSTTLSRTGLVLPAASESCDVSIINNNMQKVDGAVGTFFCTSSTRPSSPFQGMQIFETDTRMFAFYEGSSWIQYLGAGVGAANTVHEAEYSASATQSIPSGTDTPVAFPTLVTAGADVTIGTSTTGSIANAKYTLTRAGLWLVTATVRMQSAASQSGGIWLGLDGGTTRLGESIESSGGTSSGGFNVAAFRRMGVNTALNVYAWQSSGSAKNTDPLNGSNRIAFAWLRP